MKSPSQARWIDLAMAAAVTIIVPLLAFGVWPMISDRLASSPQGEVLLYEVDPESASCSSTVDGTQLTGAIERRINSGNKKLAEVQQLQDGRIEIALLRPDETERKEVERLLAQATTLEFRILANDPHDKTVIDRANADPSAVRILDDKGNLLAHWAPVKDGEVEGLKEYNDIVRRVRTLGEREIAEVLVVQDPYDLTGAYLTGAKAGIDRRGRPEISFLFNTKGGHLFRNLTGSHLPDKEAGLTYKLGIIINGELRFAPVIVSKIFNRANVSISSSMQEARELVDTLNAGSMPARIRPVEQKASP